VVVVIVVEHAKKQARDRRIRSKGFEKHSNVCSLSSVTEGGGLVRKQDINVESYLKESIQCFV
jgi:hypothetical protein